MGRLLKRIILGIACFLIFTGWGMTIDSIANQRGTYQGFEYRYNEEYQGIEITGYTGNESKVIIPATIDGVCVNSIGDYAFYGESEIQELLIPEGIDYFGKYCFHSLSLKRVEMPNNIKFMDENVFSNNTDLEEVTLPLNLTAIPNGTFANSLSLKQLNNMSNISVIGESAFEMSGLKQIDLIKCKKLHTIKRNAFRSCMGIKEIKLPASLKLVEEDAFKECWYLEKISFQKGSKLNTIGWGAFENCNSLRTVTFPKNIKKIGRAAFYNCYKLKIIKFQSKVPKIAGEAFSKINSKATFYVPNKYKSQYTSVLKKNKWLKSKMKIKKL